MASEPIITPFWPPTTGVAFEISSRNISPSLSTVRNMVDGIQSQNALADAAKTDGVRIFSPSEYASSVRVEGVQRTDL